MTRMSDSRTCTSATSATSTSNARSSLNVSVIQPSHSAAQCFQPRKFRMSATKRSATMRGVDTGSSQLPLCRGSSQSACCMVSGMCFLRLLFTPHERSNGLITALKIMVGHRCTYADMSTRQVHTLQLQLQQQSFCTCHLTPMKCPHLLSHEMTGQVDPGALDQFLRSPHFLSYSAVVSSCSAELCSVLGKDGLRDRLHTPCYSEHSVFV